MLDRPWASRAAQVAATRDELDRLGLSGPVLIGHSAGAEIAVATALQSPGTVGALVLIAPVIGTRPPRAAAAAARLPGMTSVGPAALRFGTRFLSPVLRSMWVDRNGVTPAVVEGYRRALEKPGVAESLCRMTQVSDQDGELEIGDRLSGLPCLVLVGDHDKWATSVPTAERTVVIGDCGHLPHEERPDQVLAEIDSFLGALTTRATRDAES